MDRIEMILGTVNGFTKKGVVTGLHLNDKSKYVDLEFDVITVDKDDNPVIDPSMTTYTVHNVANNQTIVDKATGAIIDTTMPDYVFNADTMIGQFDWFKLLRQTAVKIDDMLVQFLQQASALGAFIPKEQRAIVDWTSTIDPTAGKQMYIDKQERAIVKAEATQRTFDVGDSAEVASASL